MRGSWRVESVEYGSRMSRGRSGLDEGGDKTRGAGLLLSRRFVPLSRAVLSCELSRECVPFRMGTAAHLRRNDLTALMMRSLSPTLDMLISLRVT